MHTGEPGLSHYLHVLRRGIWIIGLAVTLTVVGALYLASRETTLYSSTAEVFLNTEDPAAAISNVQTPATDPVRDEATQADLARSPEVARRVLRRAGLRNRTAASFLASSSVTSASDADILTFAVTGRRPRVAERLASDYALAYTAFRRQLDTSAIIGARREIEAQLFKLKAAGERHGAVYANLFEKDQELRTLQVLQGSNASLVRASSAAVQIQPKPTRSAVLAAGLGLVLGCAIVLLRDALNTRVRSAAEVQWRLDLPQLGRLPEPSRRLRSGGGIQMLSDPRSPAAEPFRMLATNLDFVNLERNARTIMFTSATRGEGKSTTVANVAVALARSGRRVIVADLDVRKPTLHTLFGLDERSGGLTTVLLGRTSLDDALVTVPLERSSLQNEGSYDEALGGTVEVLPVGPLPPNPAELMASHGLATILIDLERRADLVVVDVPPILDLSDAMTVSARVDALVVVTRLPNAKRSVLAELRRVLATTPTTKLGFVLTGTEVGENYGAYGYGADDAERMMEETTA